MHGLIFFYLQKFTETLSTGAPAGSRSSLDSAAALNSAHYLPSNVYPDAEAIQLLQAIADDLGEPFPTTARRFGEFLAPHLVKVAGPLIDPAWRTLDLIEHTEDLIHAMIRTKQPGADPPVLETVRTAPHEIHVVYASKRRLCPLATGLLRGLARHYGEALELEEPSCMLRGDPFCSFVVRTVGQETQASHSPLTDTVVLPPGVGSSAGSSGEDPGLLPETDSLADDPLPVSIGGYRVLGLIGSGAMGRVYLAHDEHLDRNIAIKVMNRARARDVRARQRFLKEWRAAAAVEHPHVLTIYAVGEQDGLPYLVMQLLQGRTLAEQQAAESPLPLLDVLRIGREIAEGLAAAHARGLVHRDIKPENILLEGSTRSVRIIDFGLAAGQAKPGAVKITVDGAMVGTPAYMPPERIGDESLDAKSDLFGLGVMLYELLAGRLPFEGHSMVSMLASIARGMPTPLETVAPTVPRPVCDLVMRLLAHRKEDRPADATSVAAEIMRLERRFADG